MMEERSTRFQLQIVFTPIEVYKVSVYSASEIRFAASYVVRSTCTNVNVTPPV